MFAAGIRALVISGNPILEYLAAFEVRGVHNNEGENEGQHKKQLAISRRRKKSNGKKLTKLDTNQVEQEFSECN